MRRPLGERLGIYWPFPRFRFWLRHGYRCGHEWERGDSGRTDGWRMIDLGRRQMRRCGQCEYAEFR